MFVYKKEAELAVMTDVERDNYAVSKRNYENSLIEQKNNELKTEIEESIEVKNEGIMTELKLLKNKISEIQDIAQKGTEEAEITLKSELKKKAESLKKLVNGDLGKEHEVVVKGASVATSILSGYPMYSLPDVGQLGTRRLSAYDLFAKFPLGRGTHSGIVQYWDWDEATKVRAASMVAEGEAFPESTAKFKRYALDIRKIGDQMPVTEEFFEDEVLFAAELENFLRTNVELVIDSQIVNGDGTGINLKGAFASVDAYTPVASGITEANIYDLLIKVSESITSSHGSKATPDFALMNITDINKFRLKKSDKAYYVPPFVSSDGRNIDGMAIIENNAVPVNTMVVGDRRFARIYEMEGLSMSVGEVNAQFIEDAKTLKVRKRLGFLIREADKGCFRKVTNINAALVTLST